MSEYEHHRGLAIKLADGESTTQIAREILYSKGDTFDDIYTDEIEQICNEYDKEFFFHKKTETLYCLKNEIEDPYSDIIRAKMKSKGIIEYELKYYNGGAGFGECLDKAIDNIDN